jgi:hypothetical protein
MANTRKIAGKLLTAALILTAAAHPRPAKAGGFTAFAEDEDACRHAGAAAINGVTGPTAAQRYDSTYQRCMFFHIRQRQIGAYADHAPPSPYNVDRSQFPDAYYSVPYAAPGYGYDGFSPY